MATTDEPTTVARTVSGKYVNPRDLEFPFDPHGFTSMLRKEGVRAVGRIKGDDAKLKVLLETLKVIGEHAKAKIVDQKREAQQTATAQKNRADAVYARKLADQKREVKRLENLLKSAKAAVVSQKGDEADGE